MRLLAIPFALLLGASSHSLAQGTATMDTLRTGLEGALRGCETWILDPSSWIEGPAPFLAAIDLGARVSETDALAEQLLPPEEFRTGNRYWRIGAGGENGYALVVSVDLPMCHVTGGGSEDLQPAVEAILASPDFAQRWDKTGDARSNGIVSSSFQSRREPKLTLLLSRADMPDGRRDRVQVIATATYDLDR